MADPLRFAIADPPYLGRAARWYGGGRGDGGGRGRADVHADAAAWDSPSAHIQLLRTLTTYDGWAVALAPDTLPLYLENGPAWSRPRPRKEHSTRGPTVTRMRDT